MKGEASRGPAEAKGDNSVLPLCQLGPGGRELWRCTERWSPPLGGQQRVGCDGSKRK